MSKEVKMLKVAKKKKVVRMNKNHQRREKSNFREANQHKSQILKAKKLNKKAKKKKKVRKATIKMIKKEKTINQIKVQKVKATTKTQKAKKKTLEMLRVKTRKIVMTKVIKMLKRMIQN